jgi:CubicO group peptidase (beta-lactamase class C family)
VREGRIPGAGWWIEGPQGVLDHGACGSAAVVPRSVRVGSETAFDLASLTKPLCTALLLVLLEQDGVLDLREPVGDHVEEWRGSPLASRSLLALATHTAGLPAWRPLYLGEKSLPGFLSAIAANPPVLPPGATVYSDLGYIALGAVLERAAGRPLDRLFMERIAAPLGLRRTGFAVAPECFPKAAATERGNEYERALAGEAGRGHAWPTELLRGRVHDGNARALGGVAGHAGLFGTPREVGIVAREILGPGRLSLGSVARRRLLEPVAGSAGRTVGMVLAAHNGAARGVLDDRAPGHTGFTGTSVWIDPEAGAVFALLTNRVHPSVPAASFQFVRRGFHRLCVGLLSVR